MTDACESGYAVMQGNLSEEELREVGRWSERWRYRYTSSAAIAPRDRAFLHRDPLSDLSTVRSSVEGEVPRQVEVCADFPEVPLRCLEPDRWTCLWAAPYLKKEAMHVKEGRAVVAGLRHLTRQARNFGHRVVFFVDNLGFVLTTCKGRCGDYAQLRLC